MKPPLDHQEFSALLDCSARLGRDALLVQGSTGNTSLKLGDTVWIKASGSWLSDALDESIFVPVDISAARYAMGNNTDPSLTGAGLLRASVETAMHCVIPHRIVLHVHSANSIAWAVRRDAPSCLPSRLAGIRWNWIPYVPSGLPLARAIEDAVFADPGAQVFILGNHGIVVAGPDCAAAFALLLDVDKRLNQPSRLDLSRTSPASWLETDAAARAILSGGFLYPCHAIFLGAHDPAASSSREAQATIRGLAEVVSRLPESAPIRYLTDAEIGELFAADVHRQIPLNTRQKSFTFA